MKNTIFLLLASIVLCGATLCPDRTFGQYPTNETIQPYPAPIKEQTLRQRFVCDAAGSAQWKALSMSVFTPLAESLQVESSGHDPYILLPPIETPRAGTFEFRIRMKNTMNPSAEIFWMTTKQPNSCADNAVRFGFVPDGEWYTYSAQFTTTDPLTLLRFDPGASAGVAEIAWVELYDVVYGEAPTNPTPWVDPKWTEKVSEWKTISSGNVKINFDAGGTGALVFLNDKAVGEIYPLAHWNPSLPLGGIKRVPFYEEPNVGGVQRLPFWSTGGLFPVKFTSSTVSTIAFTIPEVEGNLRFNLENSELRLDLTANTDFFGPVFRPYGEMQQAVLSGVEYLEKGEHSSSTADIETPEHLRFAPSPMDITWQFMSVVTDRAAFGLVWNNPDAQPIFATPDFILGDSTKHHMGLHGQWLSGTLKITPPNKHNTLSDLDSLILWAFHKLGGVPDLPKRLRNDEEQRLLNLAAFEKSCIVGPNLTGWLHAAIPGSEQEFFPLKYGSDFVSSIWQLTGKLPATAKRKLDFGGGHLPNPASFFLMEQAEDFRHWKRNESVKIRGKQRPDGSFPYKGIYLKGHWEDTASGHCGNALYQLLYTYQILGEPVALEVALKGLEFANKYTVPRGAQVWELSLHTPDIMGSSRMCMANVWAFEATGDQKFLDHARRWAITGLPFVYLWEKKPLAGKDDPVMLYATTPVFGATSWIAPNWIGLPVQWCGLDYGEACFMLSKHDKTIDWRKIAEGILITAERMQYAEGPSIGLLPDSYVLTTQKPQPFDISPSVLVQQRRRFQGNLAALDVVVSDDAKLRVVAPYKTTIDKEGLIKIDSVPGVPFQYIVNGQEVKSGL